MEATKANAAYSAGAEDLGLLRKKLENGKDGQQYIQTHIGIGYRMLRVE